MQISVQFDSKKEYLIQNIWFDQTLDDVEQMISKPVVA
jgi:hypothetical protein